MVDFHTGTCFGVTSEAETADFRTTKVADPPARALEASPLSLAKNIPWGWRSQDPLVKLNIDKPRKFQVCRC